MQQLYQAGLITKQVCDDSSDPPEPKEIPPIILYLATDEAANINGHIFGASRGRVALFSHPTEVKGLYKDGVWTLEELVRRSEGRSGAELVEVVNRAKFRAVRRATQAGPAALDPEWLLETPPAVGEGGNETVSPADVDRYH